MTECLVEEEASAEELLAEMRRTPATAPQLEARCVRLCMPYARSIALGYAGRGVAIEDLEQVAYVALVKAIRRFRPEIGAQFRPFAAVTIRGDIKRHFRDSAWTVRPPRSLQELQARVWAARDELSESLDRSPTVAELSEQVGVDADRVGEALALTHCFSVATIDAPEQHGEPAGSSHHFGTTDAGFDRVETILTLRQALGSLPERDREIVRLRYFDGLTQRQIGDRIGVTQMQVSRLLARIMRDLRRELDGCPLAA